MKSSIALMAAFGLALITAETAFAQGYDCPFGRGSSYVPANIDRFAEYPESYGLSECRDGVCPYTQHLAQQSRSYQSQPQRPWDSQLSQNPIPAGGWRDDRRPTNHDLRDSYMRNDSYRQPSIYDSGSRYEQPRSYDRPQTYDRGLTSGPPATFDRSLTNSRAPMDDFQAHQHDGSCNHDHGPTNSRRELYDRSPSNNIAPRDYTPPRQQFNSPQQPRSDQPISEGPPPLPPQG